MFESNAGSSFRVTEQVAAVFQKTFSDDLIARADEAAEKAEAYAQKLREMGIDPDSL